MNTKALLIWNIILSVVIVLVGFYSVSVFNYQRRSELLFVRAAEIMDEKFKKQTNLLGAALDKQVDFIDKELERHVGFINEQSRIINEQNQKIIQLAAILDTLRFRV